MGAGRSALPGRPPSRVRRSKGRFVLSRSRGRGLCVGYGFRFFRTDAEGIGGDLDILIATPGDINYHVLSPAQLSGHLLGVVEGVGRLERRDYAFEARAHLEGLQRLLVGDARVLGEALIFEKSVFWSCGRVIEAGGDGVGLADLAALRLQHVAHRPVQNAQPAFGERSSVLSRGEATPRRLDTDEPNILSSDERVEGANSIRAGADAGDDGIWVAAETLSALGLHLRPYNGLEVAYDLRVRGWSDYAPYDVVGVSHVRHPVPYRLVDGVFEGARTGKDGHNLGPEELHPHHVEPLAAGVFLAHVDEALLAVEGGDGGRGDAVLAGSGLGDDTLLAHAVGEQYLAQGVVDLVRPRVREVLALEPNVGPTPPRGQALGEHQGGRPCSVRRPLRVLRGRG